MGHLKKIIITKWLFRFSDKWITTRKLNNQRFLLYDNGRESDEQIIIYETNDCLSNLAIAIE